MFGFKMVLKFLLISLFILTCRSSKTDKTLLDKATGKDVVEAVDQLIKSSGIFPDDHGLLVRLAYVWSQFGTNPATFTTKLNIWGADSNVLTRSQSSDLSTYHTKINQTFGIDWKKVQLTDLNKPLIAAIALTLRLISINAPFPLLLEDQAIFIHNFWTEIDVTEFINQSKALVKLGKCNGRMELVIVMDGSGSIQAENFKLAQSFVSNLVSTFSVENVNLGFIIYSEISSVIFPLDNNLTLADMKSKIVNSNYPSLGTNTTGAILTANDMFLRAKHREGSPRIMAIFTDGNPNIGGQPDQAVQMAVNSNITVLAIGIGGQISQANLLLMVKNQTTHVFTMSNYQSLSESFDMMNTETCKISQKPDIGKKVNDTLIKNEKRYFCYDLPNEGITVTIDIKVGKTVNYYSYTQQNPSSALNDGTFTGREYIPAPKTLLFDTTRRVCVTIEGIEIRNNFTIISEKGDVKSDPGDLDSLILIKSKAKEIAENAFDNLKDYNQIANQICNELSKSYSREQWICIVGEKLQISEHQVPNDLFQFGFSIRTADVFIIVKVP